MASDRGTVREPDLGEAVGEGVEVERDTRSGPTPILVVLQKEVPVRVVLGAFGLPEIGHRQVPIEDPLFHPRAPILQDIRIGRRIRPLRGVRDPRGEGDGGGGDLQRRLFRPGRQVDLANQGRHLVPTKLKPVGVGRSRLSGPPVAGVESAHRDVVVAPVLAGIADVIPVQAVEVVAADQVEGDLEGVLLDAGMAGVEGVVRSVPGRPGGAAGQPVRVLPVRMIRLGRRGVPLVPDVERDDPGVDVEAAAGGRIVGEFEQPPERIEPRRDIGGLRFEPAFVIGIPAFPDLDEQGVEPAAPRVGHELADFRLVAHGRVESVHPESAELLGSAAREGEWQKGGEE